MGDVTRRRGVCLVVLIEEGGILQAMLQGKKKVPTKERRDIESDVSCIKGWR